VLSYCFQTKASKAEELRKRNDAVVNLMRDQFTSKDALNERETELTIKHAKEAYERMDRAQQAKMDNLKKQKNDTVDYLNKQVNQKMKIKEAETKIKSKDAETSMLVAEQFKLEQQRQLKQRKDKLKAHQS
jgi:hypothetical protein